MADENVQDNKADYVLKDGREIRFDLSKMSVAEWRSLLDPKQTVENEDLIISKVSGLKPEDLPALGYIEWRRLIKAFFKKAQEPISPN